MGVLTNASTGEEITKVALTDSSGNVIAATNMLPSRRGSGVAISGPAPANGAANVTFTAVSSAWTSADITVDVFEELQLDVSTTTVTTSVKYVVNRKGADGVYYPFAASAIHTDSGKTILLSMGAGVAPGPSASGAGVADAATGNTNWTAPFPFGDIIQIVLTPVGAFTGTLSLKGK